MRQQVSVRVKPWVDIITLGNRRVVKEIVRLCLTGAVQEEILHLDECVKGYVYLEQVQDGWRYCSPRLLLRSIAERMGVPARSIPILPVAAKGLTLEDAFLDTFLALLCLNEGKSIPVRKIFVGAVGPEAVLDMKVEIKCGVKQVQEEHQFFIPREKRFYYEHDSFTVGADGCMYYLPPCTMGRRPSFSILLRCQKNAAVTDLRLFLGNDEGDTCEFWIQLKGSKDPISRGDVAAFNQILNVPGRRKIYVLCSTSGFTFDSTSRDDGEVLFMNLIHFMPDFLRQSVEN